MIAGDLYPMTQDEHARKLDELDHLLNDPDVPLDPSRVWSLLADLSGRDAHTNVHPGVRKSAALAAVPGGSAN
jgi:ribosomal protein L12E/L44/L45/RPP1/RPP2